MYPNSSLVQGSTGSMQFELEGTQKKSCSIVGILFNADIDSLNYAKITFIKSKDSKKVLESLPNSLLDTKIRALIGKRLASKNLSESSRKNLGHSCKNISNDLATDDDDTLQSNPVFPELENVAILTNSDLAETNEAPLVSELASTLPGSC